MKRIVFLSGKGGTGKTTLAAAFAALSDRLVIVDADVDAANLHLILRPTDVEKTIYRGSKSAVRDETLCTSCGRCREICRFEAIDERFDVDPLLCEGCGACVSVCADNAMCLVERTSGEWYRANTQQGPMVGAELFPGEEVSGKLVSVIRRKADAIGEDEGSGTIVIDGSPGIGCPVIASATGTQAAVLVTEPSRSGLHDLDRILDVVVHFGIPAFLVINKCDLSESLSDEIEAYARRRDLPILAKIPYDERVIEALRLGRSPIDDPKSPAGLAMRAAVARLRGMVSDDAEGSTE
jgi:MinD superfamily P-loop ATPase